MAVIPNQSDSWFTTWLSYILLCHASSNTNKGHKPTYELVVSFLWQWRPLVFTAAFIVGATHEHASEDLSHPVQNKLQH